MSKYLDADMLEKDGWRMQRIRRASSTAMIYEVRKPTDFPAADAEEVRHGKWEERGNLPVGCSECGCKSNKRTAYCPHCGAKMYVKTDNKRENEKQVVPMVKEFPTADVVEDTFFHGWEWNNSNIAQHTKCGETAVKENYEVRHGKWIPVDSYSAFGGDEATWIAHGNPVAFYYCSVCGEQTYAGEDGEPLITDYCPNCGAKME